MAKRKASSAESYDAIVIGAGVCGALVADRLAHKGLNVLILEAGPANEDRMQFVGRYAASADKAPETPFRDAVSDAQAPTPRQTPNGWAHYQQQTPVQFKSTYLRIAGGSTWHWLGNTPRFVPGDFQLKTLYDKGVDWPITYTDLEPWYCEAEHELGVSGDDNEWRDVLGAQRTRPFPMPPIWRVYGDRIVKAAIDGAEINDAKIEVRITPQARNSVPYQGRPPCAGNSSCVPLCPIGAKYDATVHIARATATNRESGRAATLSARSVAVALDKDADGLITAVQYDRWSADGATRERLTATARLYIVAAHSIETPLLLLASGLATKGPVGKNLMDHLQGYVGGILEEPVYPFRGPPVTSGIDVFRDGAFRREHAAFRISIGNDAWGRMEPIETTLQRAIFDQKLLGADLRSALNHRITRMLRMSYSTEMLPEEANRVELGEPDAKSNHTPKISFSLPAYNVAAFETANATLSKLFGLLNASEIKTSFPNPDPNRAFSGAGHIVGTCRMGANANDSVTDSFGRVHEHANLYVVGASLFPTSGTANPTLTAAALALRTADSIINTFSKSPA